MVIKATPQILQRVSMRWLPDPAFEDTLTIALNVGGWFMDLRVSTADGLLQWSRAGERRTLKQDPLTFEWTRIIDSFGMVNADEAAFQEMANGDSLETGRFDKNGVLTAYEEIWRDVTGVLRANTCAWIAQSTDGLTFLGRIAQTFLSMQQGKDGSFAVRKEAYNQRRGCWETAFESGHALEMPTAAEALRIESLLKRQKMATGETITIRSHEYWIRGLQVEKDTGRS